MNDCCHKLLYLKIVTDISIVLHIVTGKMESQLSEELVNTEVSKGPISPLNEQDQLPHNYISEGSCLMTVFSLWNK